MAPVIGMIGDGKTDGAISVSLFILVIGGFLGVVNKTRALDEGISSIVRKYKGKEKQLIPILMMLFALGGSTYGMAEETIAFYPLLIPVMIGVGFDSIVAVAIALIGSQVGCLASSINDIINKVISHVLCNNFDNSIVELYKYSVLPVHVLVLIDYSDSGTINTKETHKRAYK